MYLDDRDPLYTALVDLADEVPAEEEDLSLETVEIDDSNHGDYL